MWFCFSKIFCFASNKCYAGKSSEVIAVPVGYSKTSVDNKNALFDETALVLYCVNKIDEA